MRASSLVCCDTPRMKPSFRFVGQPVLLSCGRAARKRYSGETGQPLQAGDGVDRTMVRPAAGPHDCENSP